MSLTAMEEEEEEEEALFSLRLCPVMNRQSGD
jgi:hypothetical protein